MIAMSHSFQRPQLTALLLDGFLKSLVVLAFAAAVSLCLRRRAASVRHLLWFLAIIAVLCLPVFTRFLPAWDKPLWNLGAHAGSGNELTLTLELAPPSTPASRQINAASPSATDAAPGAAATISGPRFSTRIHNGWAQWTMLIWLGGMLMILASIVIGRCRLWLLRRAAQPASNANWLTLMPQLCDELRIHRRVTLLRADDDVMPVTWGWWRPVILLPAETDEWPLDRLRIVLLHELAHVKRWDCLTQMAARLACAAYWFNPLVWVAARRMCIERERACDDLVLNGGCKASDYASHLIEISRSFRRVPQLAAIAMARSSNLEGRIAAIVDASRARRASRALIVALCCLAVPAFVAVMAAQKPAADVTESDTRPWYDARLREFFAAKAAQAHQLAGTNVIAPEVWPYFEAGQRGDWVTATNLWVSMRKRAHQYEGTTADSRLDVVWGPILETDLLWEQFANWNEKYVLAYGNDIIKSIPPGSIYFGGTDPGRGVITGMSESHADAKPFFTLTQNALADGTYLDYLRAMYGGKIYTPSGDDSQRCFQEYLEDAKQRLAEKKLKPGEDVRITNGNVQVSGQVAVMDINGLLTKLIFDHNTNREFYIEESSPGGWRYKDHLSPHGLIMKINREPLPSFPEEMVRQDHEYWSNYIRPMIGDWLTYDTSVAQVNAFVERVYLNHELSDFSGDRVFLQDAWAQKTFSKERGSIGGLYAWRAVAAKTSEEKERMNKEAYFALRQAFALCPTSPETVRRYAVLLLELDRIDDAILVAETSLKLDPENAKLSDLSNELKTAKTKR